MFSRSCKAILPCAHSHSDDAKKKKKNTGKSTTMATVTTTMATVTTTTATATTAKTTKRSVTAKLREMRAPASLAQASVVGSSGNTSGGTVVPNKHKHKHTHLDTITEASADTSFESALNSFDTSVDVELSSSPLNHNKYDEEDGDDDCAVNMDQTAAHTVSCRSLANGYYFPETGLIVFCGPADQSTRHKAHDNLELVKVEEWWRPSPLESPFYTKLTDSTEGGSISAEGLLDRLRLGVNKGVTDHVHGRLMESHDSSTYYGQPKNLNFLEEGGAFYSFTCRTWMTPYEREMVKTMANMTCFEDETRDNYVPGFDIDNPDDVRKYTYVLQKSAYLLPGVHLSVITPELLSDTDYHKQCQPNGAVVWEQKEKNTFRFTRPIVVHIYNMTIQFKVSKICRADLDPLSKVMGVRVDYGILMERTKRSVPPRTDGTAKAKSILCYTAVPGGVLVTHSTVILNTAIPTIVSKVIHTFGSMGLRETCETAELTRAHILDVIAKSSAGEQKG